MKIFATCMECLKELGHPSFDPIIANYYNDSIAFVECDRGHRSALILQSLKFEILLESAVNALIDGYTLEAASALSSAYERFFEFTIKVLCSKQGVNDQELKNTFKHVSRQSERQLGGFLFLYLLEFGESYNIDKKLVKFRNKVIHKGYIPTPNEVEGFAEKVYSEIYLITQKLKSQCGGHIQKVIMADLEDRNRKLPSNMPRATSTGTIFFSLSHEEQKVSFHEAFIYYKYSQKMMLDSTPNMKALSNLIKNSES
ncbi:MAG: hypothetical protein JKX76_13860 [Colwellia sp.]|nr:hypothetical protein [Colwellia sp.]